MLEGLLKTTKSAVLLVASFGGRRWTGHGTSPIHIWWSTERWMTGAWGRVLFQPSHRRALKCREALTLQSWQLWKRNSHEKDCFWQSIYFDDCASHIGRLPMSTQGILFHVTLTGCVCHGLNLLLDDTMKLAFHQRIPGRAKKLLRNMQKPLIAAEFEKAEETRKELNPATEAVLQNWCSEWIICFLIIFWEVAQHDANTLLEGQPNFFYWSSPL